MSANEEFEKEVRRNIDGLGRDHDLQGLSNIWIREITRHKYAYNFRWMGRPIIQFPQDMVAMQEILWQVKPDLIIESGIAHGGSIIYYASLLELNAACGGPMDAFVLGIDVDIRAHNRSAIETHPMSRRIRMIEGSSIDERVVEQARDYARDRKRIVVCLDSNHTHEHVLGELNAYASLTSVGSYCVVFDTVIDDMPEEFFPNRPWGKGNNSKTAVMEYLTVHPEFEIDLDIQHKLLLTVAPDGYLKRVR